MQPEFTPLQTNAEPGNQDFLNYLTYLKKWLLHCLDLTHKDGFIFGLSGGIDSSLVAAVMHQTLPKKNYLAVTMHINNPQIDHDATDLLIKHFDLKHRELHLDEVFHAQLRAIEPELAQQNELTKRLVIGNTKARIRALNLYTLGQCMNYLVVGTTNYDEWMSGYFTKFGDNACDLAPFRQLLKKDITKLAQMLDVPQSIIARSPTASLYQGQTDEAELGFSYAQFDDVLAGKNQPLPRMQQLFNQSQHKRSEPLVPSFFRQLCQRF